MKFASKISVVIPVYNNAFALAELSSRLEDTLDSHFAEYEVLFVNDGSRDDSLLLLKKLAQLNDNLKKEKGVPFASLCIKTTSFNWVLLLVFKMLKI